MVAWKGRAVTSVWELGGGRVRNGLGGDVEWWDGGGRLTSLIGWSWMCF